MKIVLIDIIDLINHATNLEALKKLRWIRNGDSKRLSVKALDIGNHAIGICDKISALGFRNNIIYLLISPGNVLTNPYVIDKIECLQEAAYWCGIMETDRSAWREQGISLPSSLDISSTLEQVRRTYASENRFVRSVSLGIDYDSTRMKLNQVASIYEIEESTVHEILGDEWPLRIVVDPYTFYSSVSGRELIFNSSEGLHDYLNSQADLVVRRIIN